MSDASRTLSYYEEHAQDFFDDTVGVDLSALYPRFLSQLPPGGLILDAGCGSGRDSKAFIKRGFRVVAFDASPALAGLASRHLGQPVAVRSFHEVDEIACYDGIWACASLLHLPADEIPATLARLWQSLKAGGCLYLSFKLGDTERTQQGRHFTDATEERLRTWLGKLPEPNAAAGLECWITADQRPQRSEHWLNALLRRPQPPAKRLISGGREHPFLPRLAAAIHRADEIDFAVAFIKITGLRLLMPELDAALARSANITAEETEAETQTPRTTNEPARGARLRILTSDYLDVTDPEALRLLMPLQARGAQVRVFETAGSSFHLKAYLFAHFPAGGQLHGTGFIGSSNISRQALTDGLEWNYRIDYPGDEGLLEARARFETLFSHPNTRPLSDDWIEAYARRRQPSSRPLEAGSHEIEAPPTPSPVQIEALAALDQTRQEGYRRGLVVLATGLGKTWLAAFDAVQAQAQRILFVAHREEILNQAAATFLRIRPRSRLGYYTGGQRDRHVDVLCASVQTLGKSHHLAQFPSDHFDYIVVDEFHHAAAPTYRALLKHFSPRFLLGLTATPDRTDQSDILSLCDDNLVYSTHLYTGIQAGLLAPFHYYGILDDTVDYREIPWRNGKFDPHLLAHKLATLARARHALRHWREKAQQRTLAFCVSTRHADFMAEQFNHEGIRAAAVHSTSTLSRGEALQQLAEGELQVIFSVDLFNEGVDLPQIDTVLMLRPTESKILFLQQLGRGLRRAEGKSHLVVLDFIANHRSFLHKPQALAALDNFTGTDQQLALFARRLEDGEIELPEGCYINYDLGFIDFLKALDNSRHANDYEALKATLGRRPSLSEFYRSGANLNRLRQQHGDWFALVQQQGDLNADEAAAYTAHHSFLTELETTALTKCFKLVTLEALQELDGWRTPPTLDELASRSLEILQRRRPLLVDLPAEFRTGTVDAQQWQRYWRDNPIRAWIGKNIARPKAVYFQLKGKPEKFCPCFNVAAAHVESLSALVQELVDYRFASYEARLAQTTQPPPPDNLIPFPVAKPRAAVELPYFTELRIACGHFRTSNVSTDETEYRSLPLHYGHGRLDPARHFIARARGNSMNGGKHPIHDGDYLLFELITPSAAGSITGSTVAIERQDEAGDNQYLLRVVTKSADGRYILKANNPDYADLPADDSMRTFARLRDIIDPLDMAIGQDFLREDIPGLFGDTFNPGNWHSGHVVLNDKNAHVLLVTLNKQGKASDHRYLDHWIDANTFHWQTQNATTPESKRGQEIIEHEKRGIALHLFVREHKLAAGKAAPFTYFGPVRYRSHSGSAPMSVILERQE